MTGADELHAGVKIMIATSDPTSEDRKGPSFGKGAAALLRGVRDLGSLNKTAKEMHMAYSKAWALMKKVEEGLGFDLLERHGARGSVLTEKGERFLACYERYEKRVEEFAEQAFAEEFAEL